MDVEHLYPTYGMSHLEKADFFLNTKCSFSFGFQTKDWVQKLVLFPSGFSLGPLSTVNGFKPPCIPGLVRVIQENKSPSGLWNIFLRADDSAQSESCMDELDISCLCLMGLYLTNNLSFAESKQLAETIMDRTIKNEKNQVSACFTTPLVNNDQFINNPKMDLGGCINFLWCLSTLQLDDRPELLPTIELITETVEQLIQSQKSGGMFYHSTRFIIYFLLSRYLDCSTLAKEKFGTGFVQLCKTELIEMAKVADTQHALDIAAMLLTTFNLKLHIIPEEPMEENVKEIRESILGLKTALIKLQGRYGDFPEWEPHVRMEFGKYADCQPIIAAMALVAFDKLEQEQF